MAIKFCPNCGCALPKEEATPEVSPPVTGAPKAGSTRERNPEALALLTPKLRELAKQIDDMTEDQYGDWVNALSREEFYEFIALGQDGIRAIMDQHA
jgi:hypothetical protein